MFVPARLSRSLVVLASFIAACSTSERERFPGDAEAADGTRGGTQGSTPDGGTGSGSDAGAEGGGAKAGTGEVGEPCTTSSQCSQLKRADCLTDLPPQFGGGHWPGGYCSQSCGDALGAEGDEDCGPKGMCMATGSSQSSSGGGSTGQTVQRCVRKCATEADCRGSEGYSCKSGLFGVRYCAPS